MASTVKMRSQHFFGQGAKRLYVKLGHTRKAILLVQDSLRTCLVSFKNYLQEGQYHHLKTAVKGAITVFPKSPTFV